VLANRVRIVALISDEIIGILHFFDNLGGRFGVVNFTPSDFKIDRISMRIGGDVNLRARNKMTFISA
jgi:hypothetical protein